LPSAKALVASSRRYLGERSGETAVIRDFDRRSAITSTVAASEIPSWLATAIAACSVNGPTNTDSLRKTALSIVDSRS